METRGLVSKIQRYSTKDGPGIRSTVFLVGCNLRCAWCANPEAMFPDKKVMFHQNLCKRCGACVEAADNHAIQLTTKGCEIDRDACTNLATLADVCPYNAYENIGTVVGAEELVERLLRDRAFYDVSKGGVTFSGGEPCLQNEFLEKVVRILKAEGIHVAIDTAGLWSFDQVWPILEMSDLILLDIKAMDAYIHQLCTGTDNRIILENARNIAEKGKKIWVRMVIVPTMNDDLPDIKRRLDFIKELGDSVERIDLLKYHALGIGKYEALGVKYPLSGIGECDEGLIQEILAYASRIGLSIRFG